MRLWLTKCDGGRYLLTALPPVIACIRGTTRHDAFERTGEPIAVRYLCEPGIVSALGRALPPLVPTKVELHLKIIPEKIE